MDSIWITPGDALQQFAEDKFGLMRVTHKQLTELAAFSSLDALMAMARARREFPVSRPKLPRD